MVDAEQAKRRWHDSQQMTAGLLALWFCVTFGVIFFARDLGGTLGGWPVSFWMAAQGAPVIYVLLTWLYALLSHRLDETYGATQAD